MEGNQETVDYRYLRTLSFVRAVSEGRLVPKRLVPIHVGPIPADVKYEVPIRIVESTCGCDEVVLREEFTSKRLPIMITRGARHDCRYVQARNEYVNKRIVSIRTEAERMAADKVSVIVNAIYRRNEHRIVANRISDHMLTAVMDDYRYHDEVVHLE